MSSNDKPPSGSNTSRRNFLAGAVALTPIVTRAAAQTPAKTPKSETDTVNLQDSAPAGNRKTEANYTPAFFTPAEWAFVNAACARLIPQDELGPGAVELGVPQYIDRQMGTSWADGGLWYMQGPFFEGAAEFGYQSQLTPKQQFRLGIKAIDDVCQQQFKKTFAALAPADQDSVLQQIEKGTLKSSELPLRTFFTSFLLKSVMEGFFGDPMYGGNKDMGGWKMIAYPGVRGDYLEWVGNADVYPYGPVSIHGERG
jgi:gluconate 2-dehydrogenase gamma chain